MMILIHYGNNKQLHNWYNVKKYGIIDGKYWNINRLLGNKIKIYLFIKLRKY